jgi:hypothetical protein
MIVAIHQPNFFPWLGYFDKIVRADVFCLLDDVQFPKKGGSWINRVQLRVNGQGAWVTAPVDRSYSGTRCIREMRTRGDEPWRERLLKTLQCNYGRAPHFAEMFAFLEPIVRNSTDRLADYNEAGIRALCGAMGLRAARLVLSSSLATEGQATDLLISITRTLCGTAYLCGGGAGGYQEDERFGEAGLRLIRQDFRHPEYTQVGGTGFTPGLSVLDALMNCGFAGTAALLNAGGSERQAIAG